MEPVQEVPTSIRLRSDLLARIDALAERLSRDPKTTGVPSRSEAIRLCLLRGVEALEAETSDLPGLLSRIRESRSPDQRAHWLAVVEEYRPVDGHRRPRAVDIEIARAALTDSDPAIRAAGCIVFGSLGSLAPEDAEGLLAPLQQAREQDPLVRNQAAVALREIQAARVRTQKLVKYLESSDANRMTGAVVSRGRVIRPRR